MGKSLYIKRMAEKLSALRSLPGYSIQAVVPIHGPVVTPDSVLDLLRVHVENSNYKIYHFDIAPSVS